MGKRKEVHKGRYLFTITPSVKEQFQEAVAQDGMDMSNTIEAFMLYYLSDRQRQAMTELVESAHVG